MTTTSTSRDFYRRNRFARTQRLTFLPKFQRVSSHPLSARGAPFGVRLHVRLHRVRPPALRAHVRPLRGVPPQVVLSTQLEARERVRAGLHLRVVLALGLGQKKRTSFFGAARSASSLAPAPPLAGGPPERSAPSIRRSSMRWIAACTFARCAAVIFAVLCDRMWNWSCCGCARRAPARRTPDTRTRWRTKTAVCSRADPKTMA